jgi:hypothetical protein
MRPARKWFRLPVLVAMTVAALAGWSIWQSVRFAGENALLRSALTERPSHAGAAASTAPGKPAGEMEKAEAEMESARLRLRNAEATVAKLDAELAIAPAEELKSLGRIEELAVDGVKLVTTMEELSQSMQAGKPNNQKTDALTNDVPQWMVNTEAIGQMESDPAEIADLYGRALRQMLDLDENASRQVRERLTAEFELLRVRGLDRPRRPLEKQEDWYAERDRMLLEAAARIEALIPAPQRKPNAVGKIINLGSSFRFRVKQSPDGGDRKLEFFYQEPGAKPVPL